MKAAFGRAIAAAGLISLVCLAPCGVLAAPPQGASQPQAAPVDKAPASPREKQGPRTLGIVLYPQFELLDVYGPAEIFGNLSGRIKVVMVAAEAGPVASAQGPKVVADYGFADCPDARPGAGAGGIWHDDAIEEPAATRLAVRRGPRRPKS